MFHVSRALRKVGNIADWVQRGGYKRVVQRDIEKFRSILGSSSAVLSSAALGGSDDLSKYNQDWLGTTKGNAACVLRPKTTKEVSDILRYCNAPSGETSGAGADLPIAVVPQGGNTGLVAGSTPVHDEVILSLERMNSIKKIDRKSGICVVEAGCILDTVNQALENPKGASGEDEGPKLLFPLDLGAKGSCTIGGNVSTNAGGLRRLRYGNLHRNVVGVEFVKANGEVVDVLSLNKKDNTGLDLKQLMIGSEGVLGVVTQVAVSCPVKPNAVGLLCMGVDSYEDVCAIFQRARWHLGEILSAYEFFDRQCVNAVRENLGVEVLGPELDGLIGSSSAGNSNDTVLGHPDCRFGILLETHGSNEEHDQEKLFSFLEMEMSRFDGDGGASKQKKYFNGTVAQSGSQINTFWGLREEIPQALVNDGTLYSYDINFPRVSDVYRLVGETEKRLEQVFGSARRPWIRCVGFGHLGDGNLHLNVTVPKDGGADNREVVDAIEPWLWEQAQKFQGSISAEHGIGAAKTDVITFSQSKANLEIMAELKQLFDPNYILNPYKVIPGDVGGGNCRRAGAGA